MVRIINQIIKFSQQKRIQQSAQMTNQPQILNFNVLNSDRAKQVRLVEHDIDEDLNKQNIMLTSSEPQINHPKIYRKNESSNEEQSSPYDLNKAAHPVICVMTFAFKIAAFVMYLLIGNFISNILTFIIVVILSALDFWVVKNISGRLLVGLRWRSAYDNKGKQIWKFQSYDKQFKSNRVDKMFFWISQGAFTVVWAIFLLLNIITLSLFWALLVCITFGLCGTNLYGYYQCHGDHKNKLQGLRSQYGKKVFQSIAQRVL